MFSSLMSLPLQRSLRRYWLANSATRWTYAKFFFPFISIATQSGQDALICRNLILACFHLRQFPPLGGGAFLPRS